MTRLDFRNRAVTLLEPPLSGPDDRFELVIATLLKLVHDDSRQVLVKVKGHYSSKHPISSKYCPVDASARGLRRFSPVVVSDVLRLSPVV